MKTIWITALEKDAQCIQKIIATTGKYGLGADGHFWQDELTKMAWIGIKERLLDKNIGLWVIVGNEKDLSANIRYGLTLLCLALQLERPLLPILWLDSSNNMKSEDVPGIFADTPIMADSSPTLGAKLAAMANMPRRQDNSQYRLQVHANPGYGVWFEIGPGPGEEWSGVLVGVNGGEIKAHGIGCKNTIPEKCILNYPFQGMKLESGGKSYTGWGVQNPVNDQDSYFVKLDGTIQSILFGELPQGDDANLHILKM